MKKVFSLVFPICAALCMSGCGVASTGAAMNGGAGSAGVKAGASVLTSVINNFLNKNIKFTKADLVGTWSYKGADCKFESENYLKQAGGEIAASTIEGKLDESFAKLGIKEGACSFTFNEDGSYAMTIGGRELKGTYTFDEENSKLSLVGLLGLTKSEATLTHSTTSNISLLYDADKLVSMVTTLTSLSGNSIIGGLTSLLNSYDGVKIGFELAK